MARAATRSLFVLIFPLLFAISVSPASRIKVIKLAVTNPTNEARLAENIVLSVAAF
jgi:hypothetical protein